MLMEIKHTVTTDKDKELVLPVQSMQSALISDAPVKCTFIACCNLRIKSKTCFLKEKKTPKHQTSSMRLNSLLLKKEII